MSQAQPLTPQPPPQGVLWIDLKEAARRGGYQSEGSLRHRLKEWLPVGLARLERSDKRKSRWLVREDADPAFARVKSVEHMSDSFDLRQLSREHRDAVLWRKKLIDDWQAALSGAMKLGFTRKQGTAQFIAKIAADGANVSRATLFNWHAAYRQMGLKGLSDQRRERQATAADENNEFFAELKRLYLDQRKRSKQSCFDSAVDSWASVHGGEVPCDYRHACRLLDQIPKRTLALYREGSRAYDSTASPFIERDYTRIVIDGVERAMQSNDAWCADHHQFDVWVRLPGHEKPVRPWLCAWQDVRSRKIVGWIITPESPNTSAIIAALRMAIADCGTPIFALTDNGKDFDAYALQGETKVQRRKRMQTGAPPPRLGIFGLLGVQVRHAKPFNAKAKPIERAFGTLCDRFSRIWDTYSGNKPENRPADLPQKLDRGLAPTLDEFIASFGDWLDGDYHAKQHSGHGMEGATPATMYQQMLIEKRPVDQRKLDCYTMRPLPPQKIGRNGVAVRGITYGRSSLAGMYGKTVIVTVDDRKIGQGVAVWALDGKFICQAEANERLPFFSHANDLSAAMAEIKADKRTVREYHQARPRMADSLADRLYRKAAKARQAQRNETTPPPSMMPVRTVIDGELNGLQIASEHKIAVGAESLLPAIFNYRSKSAFEDTDSSELTAPTDYLKIRREDDHE
jgi:putative transposase